MRRLRPVTIIALSLALGSCMAQAPVDEGAPVVETRQQPIFGGEFATTCQWANAVMSPVCTATLIHPKVVMLAAHCMGQGVPATTAFAVGENARMPARRLMVERCVQHPEYTGMPSPNNTNSADIALCTLREPVTDIPVVPVMSACEYAALTAGSGVTLVGYGVSRYGGSDFGRKRYVETKIVRVRGDGVVVGEPGKGGCSGDSGGPAYIKMPDGTWRVIGPASITFGNPPCSGNVQGGTMYIAASKHIDWLEKESGFDVTACHANGVFDGTAAGCSNFPTNPEVGGGTWDDACRGSTMMATPQMFCSGTPTDGGVIPSRDASAPRDASGGDTARPADAAPPPDTRPPADLATPDLPPVSVPEPSPVTPPSRPDASVAPPPPTTPPAVSGCSCDVGSGGNGPAQGALVLAAGLVLGLARLRRRAAVRGARRSSLPR